jgi:DHA2 family methylenomycin A resistance protein-like MFS transporter
LLNHAYPEPQARGRAVGIWAAGASLALTAGPLAGGALIALVGWRSIFLVNLPIGIAGLWLSWRYASETTRNRMREVDLPGQILAIAALGCFAATIIEGGALGLQNTGVIAAFAGSLLLALLFIAQERRSPHPMLPLQMFSQRLFALTSLVGLLVNIAFYGLIFVFSLYFQRINGLSPLQTGLAFVPMMGMVLPANLVAARISERIGAPAAIAAGGVLAAMGCAMLLPIEAGTPYWKTLAQLMIIGGGLGLLVPPLTATLLGSVEKSRSGIAAGVLNATRQTGSVLGVALFGSLIGQNDTFVRGTHVSLVISVVLLSIASAVIWRGARQDSGVHS